MANAREQSREGCTLDISSWQGESGKPNEKVEAGVVDQSDGLFRLSWYAKIAGTYETHITVNGMHVINSPAKVVMRSTRPVIAKSKLSGPGLIDAQDKTPTTIRVLLLDEYDNVSAKPCNGH